MGKGHCPTCGQKLPNPRVKLYSSAAEKQRAYRARKRMKG